MANTKLWSATFLNLYADVAKFKVLRIKLLLKIPSKIIQKHFFKMRQVLNKNIQLL